MKVVVRCEGSNKAEIDDLKIIQVDLKQLSEKSYSKLKQQILDEGFIAPFFVWDHQGELNLLDGTQRKLTLIKMREEGIELPAEFPIVKVQADSYKQACKRILALSSQYGKLSKEGLDAFMKRADISFNEVEEEFEFDSIDFDEFRDEFDKDSDSDEIDPIDDEIPEVEENTYVMDGDLWTLGDHRVLCGDSTVKDNVDRVLGCDKIDMVFTDPPCGINFKNSQSINPNFKRTVNEYQVLKNDEKPFDPSFLLDFFQNIKEIFIWGAVNFPDKLPISTWVCWDRKITESGDKSLSGDFDLCWSKQKHKMAMLRCQWHGVFGHNKLDDGDKKNHPTMKPVKLAELFFEKWGKTSKNICDLFLGSGSTLIACEKTNRKCYGIEIDPHYVQVIIERYKTYMEKENRPLTISCERNGKVFRYDELSS